MGAEFHGGPPMGASLIFFKVPWGPPWIFGLSSMGAKFHGGPHGAPMGAPWGPHGAPWGPHGTAMELAVIKITIFIG